MNRWIALRIQLPSSLEDEIAEALSEAGTLGMRVYDSDRPEPPPPGEAKAPENRRDESPSSARRAEGEGSSRIVIAYFPRDSDLQPLTADLERIPQLVLETFDISEEPWVEDQERSRTPIAVGRRFQILPAVPHSAPGRGAFPDRDRAPSEGMTLSPAMSRASAGGPQPTAGAGSDRPDAARRDAFSTDGRIVLVIPPRRAFGTGEHATTRFCLELLESTEVEGRRVLDFGTGSGILAMASSALGAASVIAIDNDPEAIEIARETLVMNGFRITSPSRGPDVEPRAGESDIDLRQGDLSIVSGRYSLIVANIHAGPLEERAPVLAALQGRGDEMILSGFSPVDAEALGRVYGRFGYTEVARLESTEWTAIRLERER